MINDIFIWWLVAQALGLAGLPLAQFFLGALPDRGYAFSKTLGLLLTGYLAWLLAMIGLAPFGAPLLIVCGLVVGLGGWRLTRHRNHESATGSPVALGMVATPARALRWGLFGERAWLRERWRMLLGYEAIFALALIFLALLRSYEYMGFIGPHPWGTERPMDYALFNAIRSSASFPPHDPWLAGYSINYYYFGYLLMAVVALLSGREPPVAYNLALALIFALTALGVAGIVYNLITLTRGTNDRPPRSSGVRGWASVPACALGVVLVLFAANQGGALQAITGTDMAVALDGRDLARAVVNGLGPRAPLPLSRPFAGDYFDGTAAITPTDALANFNWWNSSRAVWDDYTRRGTPAKRYAITEFPFFSFWLGDMHPHVMALPFGLLALALALQTVARSALPTYAQGRYGWLDLLLVGVTLGSLYAINSWDLPTYVLLFLGALLILHVRHGVVHTDEPSGVAPHLLRRVAWRAYGRQAGLALLAAGMLFVPFHLTFRSLVAGRGVPIGIFSWWKTPLHSFLIIFGLFLVPLVAYVVALSRQPAGRAKCFQIDFVAAGPHPPAPSPAAAGEGEDRWGRPAAAGEGEPEALPRSHPISLTRSLGWTALAILALGPLIGFPLLFLLPLGLYAATLALERADRPAAAYTLWAFALGCLICFGTEVVYIRDVFEGYSARLNSIFKFYYQAWLIWGTLAAYALWWLFAGSKDENPELEGEARRGWSTGARLLAAITGVLFLALLAGAMVYPWMTAGKAFREGQRIGLAGKTPREETPAGAAAIAWLRANAPADAVILEAVGGAYDTSRKGFGQVSASTGLATVLGWPGHEQQWRGGAPEVASEIAPREADVHTIYSTTDVELARSLLAKYGVDYIYVGEAERSTYPPEGLAKLAQLGDAVFEQDEVVIYRMKDEG